MLDLGCGEGGVLHGYLDGASSGIGIDIAERLVRVGASVERTVDAHFAVADARTLPFADATFDLVIVFDVLEHVVGWQTALLETARVLRHGGVAFVTAANPRSPITILDDPHWHLPLVAVLPRHWSERLTSVVDPEGLDMGGEHPGFPSWRAIIRAFRAAGLRPQLVSNIEKVVDPESVVAARRRALAHTLNSWRADRWLRSTVGRRMLRAYDRFGARSWTFLAVKPDS